MKIRLLLGVVLNANFRLIKLRQRQATKPLAVIVSEQTQQETNGQKNETNNRNFWFDFFHFVIV